MNFLKINNSFLSFCMVPLISFWNPHWFSLMGSQPVWPLFWLLPWTIINGPFYGFISALLLGLVLDSINNSTFTQIPGLVFCVIWFSKLDINTPNYKNKFKYGLICSIGALFCSVFYFAQIIYFTISVNNIISVSYGIKSICGQIFLTGLFAPVFCSWLFYIFEKDNSRYPLM